MTKYSTNKAFIMHKQSKVIRVEFETQKKLLLAHYSQFSQLWRRLKVLLEYLAHKLKTIG